MKGPSIKAAANPEARSSRIFPVSSRVLEAIALPIIAPADVPEITFGSKFCLNNARIRPI